MNTARIDSLLNRQKKNLVTDALYALVMVVGLTIGVLGLGIGTSPAEMADAPVAPAELLVPTSETAQCTSVIGAPSTPAQAC